MNKGDKKLFVKVEGIVETNLLRKWCSFNEFATRFMDAMEAQGWQIVGSFIPVNEKGRRIKMEEAKG